jgi:hypothetical protein
MLPYQPSLASATNTRVDSACKHHHQCRVSTDDMLQLMEPINDQEELKRNEYRYCAHKDELIVGVGRPWRPEDYKKKMNNAYPRVISNLGMMDGNNERSKTFQKMITYMCHYCTSLNEKQDIINWFKLRTYTTDGFHVSPDHRYFKPDAKKKDKISDDTEDWLGKMHDYVTMGFSQTMGYAHPACGDTMTTVMIGGMRTVMNGDFEIHNGDVIQWYWPFEKDCFTRDGKRKKFFINHVYTDDDTLIQCNLDPTKEFELHENQLVPSAASTTATPKDAALRESYHNKIYGQPNNTKKMVAFIKPFCKDFKHPRMYDEMRVFARAIGSARPHEMCDIKICRQSL